jgi:transcriptional regulator with XRE-family HTH domain
MDQKTAFPQLREQAIALRRAGKSRREIKEILGIHSNETLNDALRGEPPKPWMRNVKPETQLRARELRQQGLKYNQIATELGVSKSSVSLWVRDLPMPERLSPEECRRRSIEGLRRYWAIERPLREAERRAVQEAAAAEIGNLTDRELLIAGAIAYWCEGAKNKPYRQANRVIFTNSDPALISLFLRFLDAADVSRDLLICRVQIHADADVLGAQKFWLGVTGAAPAQFRRPALKRHNPKTTRKNTGADYHGCLRIEVRHSISLYRKIEGWASAAMDGGYRGLADSGYLSINPGNRDSTLPGEDSNLGRRDQNP